MEDNHIIQLFFQRNESAINESKQKYGKLCQTVAYNILGNREDAEECVNDTLLRAWNSIPPDQPHSLLAYLRTITRNLAYDRYRSRKRNRRGNNTVNIALEEIDSVFTHHNTPESEQIQKEMMHAISEFVNTLKEFDRNVFLCRYYYFFSVNDIAAQHGKSRQHINVILTRTLKKLKEYLEKENYL